MSTLFRRVNNISTGKRAFHSENGMEHKITIKTKHGELSLDQLAEVQPGIARLMKEIGERYHVLYYAAKRGNWKLAQYEVNVVTSILNSGSTLRPKFAEDFTNFAQKNLHEIGECIKAEDWERFEGFYMKSVEEANRFHEKHGYGFIRYVLPRTAPVYLDLDTHV